MQINKSLFAKLSAAFSVLQLVLACGLVASFLLSWSNVASQSKQSNNWDLADTLKSRFNDLLKNEINPQAIQHQISKLQEFNPDISIYILDSKGIVKFSGKENSSIKRALVNLEPISKFLSKEGIDQAPIFGSNPLGEKDKEVFSVSPIKIGNEEGYLYVVFESGSIKSIISVLSENVGYQWGAFLIVLTISISILTGVLFIASITKRFNVLTAVLAKFQTGDFSSRVKVNYRDEITELMQAVNTMADTIEQNIQELKRRDVLRKDLIANVSHDLRTPISSINGYAETLVRKISGMSVADRKRCLDGVLASGRALEHLVKELFELSKLEAEEQKPLVQEFSICELANSVVKQMRQMADSSGIELSVVSSSGIPNVVADSGMINRVISNLVTNALQHTPEHGKVSIILHTDGDYLYIEVSDTGVGIPHDKVPRLFERFYSGRKSASTTLLSGTGLGLAIVKKIIELHQSEISVVSEVNKGTTFIFYLPIASQALSVQGSRSG